MERIVSDWIFPLVLLVGLFFLFRWRRNQANSPGSKRVPTHGSPILKQISHQLFEELALPSQTFRQEMGLVYPDLAMAFRQSLNFGVIRYTNTFWQQNPDETLMPDIINRLLCDYYGFILPRNFTPEDVQTVLSAYFKQKKQLRKTSLTGNTLRVSEKDVVLASVELEASQDVANIQHLQRLFKVLADRENLSLFRQTQAEYGFILLDETARQRLQPYALIREPEQVLV